MLGVFSGGGSGVRKNGQASRSRRQGIDAEHRHLQRIRERRTGGHAHAKTGERPWPSPHDDRVNVRGPQFRFREHFLNVGNQQLHVAAWVADDALVNGANIVLVGRVRQWRAGEAAVVTCCGNLPPGHLHEARNDV